MGYTSLFFSTVIVTIVVRKMNGFDIFTFIGYAFVTTLFILGLGVLLITYRSTRKSIIALRNRNFGPSRNGFLAWVALILTSFGLFFVIVTLRSESVRRDSAQLLGVGLITSFLFIFGAISANFISLPPQLLKPSTWLTKRLPRVAWVSHHKIISLVVLLGAIFLLSQAYGGIVERNQRKNFEEARIRIDNIYAQIVSEIGPPDNHKVENSCSVQQQEFNNPHYSCMVEAQLVYKVVDEVSANNQIENALKAADTAKMGFKHIGNFESKLTLRSDGINTYLATNNSYRFKGLNCSIYFVYDSPKNSDLTLANISDKSKPLYGSTECDGPALSRYY